MSENSKPKRSVRSDSQGGSKKIVKPKVLNLTFNNILFMGLLIFGVLLAFNFVNRPSLGREVKVDEFLSNLRDNRYSSVDIRNDGNSVGIGKYIEVVGVVEDEDYKSLAGEKVKFNDTDSYEEKEIKDLVNIFKTSGSPLDLVKSLRGATEISKIRGIYVLENSILVDRVEQDGKNWLIPDVSEREFVSAFDSENIDIVELSVDVHFLRSAGTSISSSEFIDRLGSNRYENVWNLSGRYYAQVSKDNRVRNYVNFGTATADFTKFLQEEGFSLNSQSVEFRVLPISRIDIATIVNLVLIGGLLFVGFMLIRSFNGANGGLMKFGQSKARVFFGQKTKINFDDVAGVDEAKEQLKEVVDFLRNPKKYQRIGAKIPRGVLMVGEPGTGKTLMARAVAGEAGVPFFHTSGSEFEEMLVGAGASRVRDLFDKAKKASPSLIFIDEIDAVGRKRGTTIQSSSTEQTLNQILVEMDGFEERDNVIVIAATNRPDVLDPALLRPGRFDRKVVLDQPDIDGRKAILKIHAANKPLAKEVDLEVVAKRTIGFSGADLENMLNEAAIIVAKEGRNEIDMKDIEEAATKVQTGPVRKRNRTEQELKMTAYHEAGHALVMRLTPESDPVHRITILSRGMALGYVMPLPATDQLQMTKTKMESKIKSLLAGYASEELVFGDVTTGASNDIEKATSIARNMVKKFGMSKKLGLVRYGLQEDDHLMGYGYSGDKSYSESSADMIDNEVRAIIESAYKETTEILKKHKDLHKKIAETLLEKEVLEGDEFEELFTA